VSAKSLEVVAEHAASEASGETAPDCRSAGQTTSSSALPRSSGRQNDRVLDVNLDAQCEWLSRVFSRQGREYKVGGRQHLDSRGVAIRQQWG
jgi:hypothetical protein